MRLTIGEDDRIVAGERGANYASFGYPCDVMLRGAVHDPLELVNNAIGASNAVVLIRSERRNIASLAVAR